MAGMEINRLDLDIFELRCLRDHRGGMGQKCPSTARAWRYSPGWRILQKGQNVLEIWNSEYLDVYKVFSTAVSVHTAIFLSEAQKKSTGLQIWWNFFKICKKFKL